MHEQIQSSGKIVEHVFNDWRDDLTTWLRHDAPKLLVILLVAFIFLQLLRLITNRLVAYSRNQVLPGGLRAQQLRSRLV